MGISGGGGGSGCGGSSCGGSGRERKRVNLAAPVAAVEEASNGYPKRFCNFDAEKTKVINEQLGLFGLSHICVCPNNHIHVLLTHCFCYIISGAVLEQGCTSIGRQQLVVEI